MSAAQKQEEDEKEKAGITDSSSDYKMRHCYVTYVESQRCIKKKGEMAAECEKIGKHFRSFCPKEWVSWC
ncbi:hypothetical protein Fmac_002234 [Flemingia macrophylla]|uniref:Uncharacterized protein n=1 Tax=Flemingia macrophylla TaxID=520843 RepID=A0ABD1NJB9_9FABA